MSSAATISRTKKTCRKPHQVTVTVTIRLHGRNIQRSKMLQFNELASRAGMAELADAADSKSAGA